MRVKAGQLLDQTASHSFRLDHLGSIACYVNASSVVTGHTCTLTHTYFAGPPHMQIDLPDNCRPIINLKAGHVMLPLLSARWQFQESAPALWQHGSRFHSWLQRQALQVCQALLPGCLPLHRHRPA